MDELIAALEAKTRARAEEIMAEAREKAEGVRAAAERETERLEREHLAERAATWRAEAARRIAEARSRGRREGLLARAEFLDRVFDRALERIRGGEPPAGYEATVAERVRSALRYLGGRAACIDCPSALADEVWAAVADVDPVEVDVDPRIPMGFRVRAEDGSVAVDATLAGEIARRRGELAIEVLERFERTA